MILCIAAITLASLGYIGWVTYTVWCFRNVNRLAAHGDLRRERIAVERPRILRL
jgi:ABC-type transport system involved in cytochrome c biogenesis permease subunit